MDLLESESETEEVENFKINTSNNYAEKYDSWRQKEHLQKLKDKYGDDFQEESEDSDESSDDSDAEELTQEIEKDFFTTLASLKTKDPAIYDGTTNFFKDGKSSSTEISKEKKVKKVTLADVERQVMVEKGGQYDEIEDENIKYGPTYNEEMKELKDSFKNALDDDENEDLLQKRTKTAGEEKEEAADFKAWLAGQKEEVEDQEIKSKMSGLRDFWNKKDLDDGEKFLKDYLLNKRYKEQDNEDRVPSYDEVVHDSDEDLSEDEKNVEKMEEFEHKFNFRFEEPDEDFIKRYPRTIKGTMRKEEDKRAKKRKDVEERKKREKEQKKEEIKVLKSMKKKEIMDKLAKLKQITGNEDMALDDDDIEGDFDPEKYDKRMQEIFNNYDDNVEINPDEEKPTFSDIEEDYDEDEDYIEDWDNWDGVDTAAHCEDEDFNMDCDYEENKKIKEQEELIENTKGRRKGRRKSKFAEAVETSTAKPVFDPSDKTFEAYVDEYYKLDCEDVIGDLPCRFKYRNVPANDFGLSVEELLGAKDSELNAWVSLRKTCQYRSEEEERKDFHVYKNKSKNEDLKKKVLPTLFEDVASLTEEKGVQEEGVETTTENNSKKKRKRKNRKKKKQTAYTTDEAEEENTNKKAKLDSTVVPQKENLADVKNPKTSHQKHLLNKKQKKKPALNNSAIHVKKIAGFFEKSSKSSSNPIVKRSEELSKISNERLKAYGVNPTQFKRKLKTEIYKQIDKDK